MQNIRLVEGITTKLLTLKQGQNPRDHPLHRLQRKKEGNEERKKERKKEREHKI